MQNERDKKDDRKQNGRTPGSSDDHLGENAGEGRLMKEQAKKEKHKL